MTNKIKIPKSPFEQRSDNQDYKMIPVWMSASELAALDSMQGGPSFDDNYPEIREYSRLAPAFEMPEIRQLFLDVKEDIAKDGDLDEPLKKIYKGSTPIPNFVPSPSEETEPLKSFEEKEGRNPDKHLILIPENMLLFFLELDPHITTNPKDGLFEFWGLKNIIRSVVRVGATVGGALLGGPIGAGLGNMAGRALTGQKVGGDMLMGGLKNAAYTYGAQALGQMAGLGSAGGVLGSGVGGTGSLLGNAASQGFGPQNYGAYGSLFGNTAGGTTAPIIDKTGALGQGAGATAAGATGAAAAPASSLFSGSNLMMPAMMGLALMGQKKNREDQEKYYEREEHHHRQRRHEMGQDLKWVEPPKVKRTLNPHWETKMNEPIYHEEPWQPTEHRWKKGGSVKLVKGPGDGQADKIKTSVPNGSYIIDASSVADFGNGSSERGHEVLEHFIGQIRKSHKRGMSIRSSQPSSYSNDNIPVWLSNDEVSIDPQDVSAVGEGDNNRGAKMLKHMVKELRKHKASKGDRLPPAALSPMKYMRRK